MQYRMQKIDFGRHLKLVTQRLACGTQNSTHKNSTTKNNNRSDDGDLVEKSRQLQNRDKR